MTDEEVAEFEHGVQQGYEEIAAQVAAKRAAEKDAPFVIRLGLWEGEYRLYTTSAPPAYDGFGTIEIYDRQPTDQHGRAEEKKRRRTVLVNAMHEDWQIPRYHSGGHHVEKHELSDGSWQQWLTERLSNRLMLKKEDD